MALSHLWVPMTKRLRIAIIGKPPAEWASLGRTFRAYMTALQLNDCDVICVDTVPPESDAIDILLGFWGSSIWTTVQPNGPPRIICLHGGAVVNIRELPKLLPTLRELDVLICNCWSDIRAIKNLGVPFRGRMEVVALPVDSTIEPIDSSQAKALIGASKQAILVGFVGRLVPQKGLHHFLRTLAYCNTATRQEVHGLVIGDFWPEYTFLNSVASNYRYYIAGLISAYRLERHVKFLPFVTGDERLSAFYSSLDLLLHPTSSPDENFGYVPLEALKCGTPVVTTAYGGLKDTVCRLDASLSVPTWATDTGVRFDLYGFMSKSARILNNPQARQNLGVQGAALVGASYGIRAFAQRLNEVTAEVALRVECRHESVRRDAAGSRVVMATPGQSITWEQVRPAVDAYVSTRPCDVSPSSRFYLWPGSYRAPSGSYIIQDPAWPMAANIQRQEQRLVAGIPGGISGLPSLIRPAQEHERRSKQAVGLVAKGILAWTGDDAYP
jgi:glycosyltransferase involved in cell wall biosynthesis